MRTATWSLGAALLLAGVTAQLRAQQPAKPAPKPAGAAYTPAKTPWGDPRVGGVYSNDDETGIPFERPAEFAGRRIEDITPAELAEANKRRTGQFNAGSRGRNSPAACARQRTSSPIPSTAEQHALARRRSPDGVPPLTEEARQRAQRPQSGLGRASATTSIRSARSTATRIGLYDRCVTRGVPSSMMPAGYGSFYEIIQGQESVSLRYEMIHEHRVVPIDRGGRRSPHLSDRIHLDLGDARGWYDGNTLVVETTNFTERSAFRGASEHLKMTERFTPVAPNVVEWRVTFDDPHTWTKPWTFAMILKERLTARNLHTCHEGNYGLKNILTGARARLTSSEALHKLDQPIDVGEGRGTPMDARRAPRAASYTRETTSARSLGRSAGSGAENLNARSAAPGLQKQPPSRCRRRASASTASQATPRSGAC
jgi:hypothetical protein